MKKVKYKGLLLVIAIFAAIMVLPGCAASKKREYAAVRKKNYLDTTQLGRNRYFFSKQYQKKLYKFKKR